MCGRRLRCPKVPRAIVWGCVGLRCCIQLGHLGEMAHLKLRMRAYVYFVAYRSQWRLDFPVRAELVGSDSPPRSPVPGSCFPSTPTGPRKVAALFCDVDYSVTQVKAQQPKASASSALTNGPEVYRLCQKGVQAAPNGALGSDQYIFFCMDFEPSHLHTQKF